MSNLEKYNRVFMETFDVDEAALNADFTFACVEKWDSVAHLSLVSSLEDAFDVMLTTDDILHYGSYENGKRILQKLGIEL